MLAGQYSGSSNPDLLRRRICNVDGLKYAWDVSIATLARAGTSIFYDRKYDCAVAQARHEQYGKRDESPHSRVVKDVGAVSGYSTLAVPAVTCRRNWDAGCHLTAVDQYRLESGIDEFSGST